MSIKSRSSAITPNLSLSKDDEAFIYAFIKDNYPRFPIFSNRPFETKIEDSIWLRQGLLFRLYQKDNLPSSDQILQINKNLWDSYHDPLASSLAKYKNLALANYRQMKW